LVSEQRSIDDRVRQFTDDLYGSEEALRYLIDRGFSNNYIDRYSLGYCADGYFAPSITIPYKSALGEYTGIKYRRLADNGPKYDKARGEASNLFNVGDVRHPEVWLTEGEFNAITLIEQGGVKAVATGGASNMKDHWWHLFYGSKVFVAFDGDDAGRRAGRQWGQFLHKHGIEFVSVELPEGHDVNSYYLENPGGFKQWLAQWQ
jgi:DNA primase